MQQWQKNRPKNAILRIKDKTHPRIDMFDIEALLLFIPMLIASIGTVLLFKRAKQKESQNYE